MITAAANANMNPKESLAFSQHNSMFTQENYQRENGASEMAKFNALGVTGKRVTGKRQRVLGKAKKVK